MTLVNQIGHRRGQQQRLIDFSKGEMSCSSQGQNVTRASVASKIRLLLRTELIQALVHAFKHHDRFGKDWIEELRLCRIQHVAECGYQWESWEYRTVIRTVHATLKPPLMVEVNDGLCMKNAENAVIPKSCASVFIESIARPP